ncbi:MAG: exosortase/archaeosortase family protein [Candidatus Omnitrophica bacterium]|nr:exosortase/archaeosortase family protein [Candidatus Omnitrophota bacterium]
MLSKRKKTVSFESRHVYTTKQIIEITEQRRLKMEAAVREAELKAKTPENKPAPVGEDLNPPFSMPASDAPPIIEKIETSSSELADSDIKEENVDGIISKNPIPANASAGFVVLILSLISFFFIVASKFSESWVNTVTVKINALIVHGSFFVLSAVQGGCTVKGGILSDYFYKLSLQGDLVALYSLGLVIVFAALFVFFHKTTWLKRGAVFIFLISLVITANIFRVVLAFGLALNYGAAYADNYFHGILVVAVFIFIVLGLIFLESLFSLD